MKDQDTSHLSELIKALGADVIVGLIEISNAAVVADCRAGSRTDTDFADQSQRQFLTVFGVACGPLEQATLCAILFRKRAALERFWRNNPKLRHCMVTRWPGTRILW